MRIKALAKKIIQGSKVRPITKLLQDSKIGLIDIGSSGGLEPRWQGLTNYLSCFLFEPDERSYKELAENLGDSWLIYPTALYNKPQKIALNLCRKPQVSSLYSPNRNFLDLFSNKGRWDIVATVELAADCLDNVIAEPEIREQCDFIKLDTQGSELSILQGSVKVLEHVLGVEVEAEFVSLYENQPLFGDVCGFLEQYGFSFVDFTSLFRWKRNGYTSGKGQLVFADALFLKPPEVVVPILRNQLCHEPEKAKSKLLRYISLCILYEKFDYVSFIYDHHSNEFDVYLQIQDSNIFTSNERSLKSWVQRSSKRINDIIQKV